MKGFKILLLLCLAFSFFSCEKEEGEGGNSTIRGKVLALEVDNNIPTGVEYYLPDERVYLVYGAEGPYDDIYRTHFDGTFEFNGLRTGKYSVYAYSLCVEPCDAEVEPIIKELEITERNSTVELEDLIVFKKN